MRRPRGGAAGLATTDKTDVTRSNDQNLWMVFGGVT